MAETKTLSAVSTWQFASRCQAEPERSLCLVFLVGGGPRLVSPTGRWACAAVTASVSRLFLSHSFYFLQLTFCTTEVGVSLEKNTFNSSHSSPPPRNMSPEENGVGGGTRGEAVATCAAHSRARPATVAYAPCGWRCLPFPGVRRPVLVLGHRPAELGSMAAQLGLPSHPDPAQERPGRQVGGSHASTQPGVTGVKCRAFMGLTDRVT